ncbi:hypothetical protein [Parahaliea mediterranea]|uniref:Uncharacterized protein n=1 Tax=Parahaliea mediterranea TaxID=651086 RepID=A0A939IMV1_9GAMM|nr:hypothetical protein [Parahaliea mediterranea]MBN7797418.1 hypothetical protein [Parahaliea mediterranea]
MEAVVYMLGGMGVTALCLSAFVFVTAARFYVSGDGGAAGGGRDPRYFVKRSRSDRRRRACHSFPFEINGVVVERDRRSGRERRLFTH